MSTDKIFTFGDGFAHSHIWPEWPLLLSAIYPGVDFKNYTGIGAGNEFLTNAIIEQFQKDPGGIFIVQWSIPGRFDKLIENSSWNEIIKADNVYKNNYITCNDKKWWLSSSSNLPEIKLYHKQYVERDQAELRTFRNILLIKNLFENNNIDYIFLFAFEPKYLKPEQRKFLSDANWAWHTEWHGIDEFSRQEKYKDIRQQEVQPSPIVHMDWVIEVLLKKIKFPFDVNRLDKLKKLVDDTHWQAFYWDRKELWNKILRQL